MPSYIVRFKPDASKEHMEEVKKSIKDKGGQVTHEHKLIKAYTATFPEDHVGTLDAHPAVDEVEADKTMTTQSAGVLGGGITQA